MALTEDELNGIKEALLTARASLLRRLKHAGVQLGTRDGDTADISVFDRDAALFWELEDQECTRLVDIDEALRRVDGQNYGLCEACGGAIPYARLNAVPFARRCVTCQEDSERSEAPRGERGGTAGAEDLDKDEWVSDAAVAPNTW